MIFGAASPWVEFPLLLADPGARWGQARPSILPATLAIIFVLLYLTFGRFDEALLIMATLPFALVGGVWFLHLMGYHLSVATGVGFIALAGVAAEFGVVMLLYLKHALRDRLKAAAPHAEKQRIKLLVENVWATFLISPFDMARFVDEIGSPWVQVHFDLGNMMRWGISEHWAQILGKRIQKLDIEVELGFTAEQAAAEVQRCLNCDVQTVFSAAQCIECDACVPGYPLVDCYHRADSLNAC